MDGFFIRDAAGLIRIASSAVVTYVSVVVFVRAAGKRATSQMNNFDWIVTVAIGSVVGSTIVLRDLPLLEGIVAVGTLLAVQYAVTKLSIHTPAFSRLVHASPTLLFYRGAFIYAAMKKERVTEQEILSAIRQSGIHATSQVEAVVLETDAKLSVLSRPDTDPPTSEASTLAEVSNYSQVT
ncbi:DUF421 domain-containing protein [Aeoliella sp.]|uniref:DUF421 domain-containing protein n=1 Tax=Aeoliella sp. TaxID=2795800 RepID=UPI003CCBBB1A